MSRGLGRRQLTILGILARHEAGEDQAAEDAYGLRVKEIALRSGPEAQESAAAHSSIRRALATMRSAGLVHWKYWYAHDQGRPRLWTITDAGLAEVERRGPRPGR